MESGVGGGAGCEVACCVKHEMGHWRSGEKLEQTAVRAVLGSKST